MKNIWVESNFWCSIFPQYIAPFHSFVLLCQNEITGILELALWVCESLKPFYIALNLFSKGMCSFVTLFLLFPSFSCTTWEMRITHSVRFTILMLPKGLWHISQVILILWTHTGWCSSQCGQSFGSRKPQQLEIIDLFKISFKYEWNRYQLFALLDDFLSVLYEGAFWITSLSRLSQDISAKILNFATLIPFLILVAWKVRLFSKAFPIRKHRKQPSSFGNNIREYLFTCKEYENHLTMTSL